MYTKREPRGACNQMLSRKARRIRNLLSKCAGLTGVSFLYTQHLSLPKLTAPLPFCPLPLPLLHSIQPSGLGKFINPRAGCSNPSHNPPDRVGHQKASANENSHIFLFILLLWWYIMLPSCAWHAGEVRELNVFSGISFRPGVCVCVCVCGN
jgi:hypothetical protein